MAERTSRIVLDQTNQLMSQTLFQYHPTLVEQYSTIQTGALFVTGLRNGPTSAELHQQYTAEQAAVKAKLPASLSDVPALAAWRAAFRRFGVDPTKYRCAAEALLRRLSKSGDIPSINTLVDIGNLVSIRYALPLAVFDWRAVRGTVTVHNATGSERFTELGNTEFLHPDPGEVVFADETAMVMARRWCWRQSAESAAQPDSTTVLIVIEAHHAAGATHVDQAVADLTALLNAYTGGQITTAHLNAQQRTFVI